MNPTPPIPPPVGTAAAARNTRGRKIAWGVIATALAGPPILLAGYLIDLNAKPSLNPAWLWQHPGMIATAGLVSVGLTWLGLQRGWHQRRRLLWGVGITALLGLGVSGLAVYGIRHVLRSSADKAALSTLRQIESAANQYYLENPYRFFLNYDELIGPDRYVKATFSVEGEDQHELFPIRRDQNDMGSWILTLPDGRQIGYNVKVAPKPDGVDVVTQPDGSRVETTYRAGRPAGPFHAYYASGKLWSEATYEHGRLTGPRWLYLPDGTRFDEAQANAALKHADLGQKQYRERDLASAIAEFSQAIELNPAASDYFLQRGDAYVLNGELPAAHADYTRSLDMFPYYTTYYQRGHVRRLLPDAPGAAADFRAAYLPDRYSPAMFWLYLTEWEQGHRQEVTAEMTAAVERMMHDPEDQQIGKFLLGQITEAQLLEATQRGRHGDIYMVRFYIALRAQLAGDQPGAMERFRQFLQLPVPAMHDQGKVSEIGDGHWFERAEARRALQAGGVADPTAKPQAP